LEAVQIIEEAGLRKKKGRRLDRIGFDFRSQNCRLPLRLVGAVRTVPLLSPSGLVGHLVAGLAVTSFLLVAVAVSTMTGFLEADEDA
jgi:hypothetical protein